MKTTKLAQQLIQQPSITPNDFKCQNLMIKRLEKIGFKVTRLKFGKVKNFFAIRGNSSPVFMFAGHTDVVPVGDEKIWRYPPFAAKITDNILHGRGAADMKGSLASMVVAAEEFVKENPNHSGSIAFLITADEEGIAIDGTIKVCEYLQHIKQNIDYCLVGEPSSSKVLGDIIKNGRRGSLNGYLEIIGKQGHIAYPHLANNPIHLATDFLQELTNIIWDSGDKYFDATSLQISNINSGTGATNVIPQSLNMVFNFRYNTTHTHTSLQQKVEELLTKHKLDYKITWRHSGASFVTKTGDLLDACVQSCFDIIGVKSKISTGGGTSDGRFIAPMLQCELVELGPLNTTIHQINECISLTDLENLTQIYKSILYRVI